MRVPYKTMHAEFIRVTAPEELVKEIRNGLQAAADKYE